MATGTQGAPRPQSTLEPIFQEINDALDEVLLATGTPATANAAAKRAFLNTYKQAAITHVTSNPTISEVSLKTFVATNQLTNFPTLTPKDQAKAVQKVKTIIAKIDAEAQRRGDTKAFAEERRASAQEITRFPVESSDTQHELEVAQRMTAIIPVFETDLSRLNKLKFVALSILTQAPKPLKAPTVCERVARAVTSKAVALAIPALMAASVYAGYLAATYRP